MTLQRRRRSQPSNNTVLASVAASYARYSSDLQDEKSIEDQQRECRDAALQMDLSIEPEFGFSDSAISGTKLRRVGLDRLLAQAQQRRFQILFFHNLSRLARESVITMPMMKELVYVHRVRVISISEGIDTIRPGWEVNAVFASLHHEQFIKDLSANVHRGQVGTVLARFCVGDLRLGYTSVPSPDGEMIGRGRNAKQRKVYEIDQEEAKWVRQIFRWFVVDRRPLSWIVRELTRLQAPKDHRASTSVWQRQLVIGILRSSKYIGLWHWGRLKNVRNPLTGAVSQEERPDEETDPWLREFPDLRIIDDATYDTAQRLLDQNCEAYDAHRNDTGQLNGSPKDRGRQHLLSCLFQCSQCGSKLYVGGAHGKSLKCPGYRDGVCECRTHLPRALAEQLILDAIGERILANPQWRAAVHETLLLSWQQMVSTRPDDRRELDRQIEDCERRIKRLVDQIEDSVSPDPELKVRLSERRTERNELAKRDRQLQTVPEVLHSPPTSEWTDIQLVRLGDALRSSTPAAAEALRNLLHGPIIVEEVPVPDRKRRYWRGRMNVRIGCLAATVAPQLANDVEEVDTESELVETITLDFRPLTKTESQGDKAWALYEQGSKKKDIAVHLNVSRSRITAILQAAAKKRGIVKLPRSAPESTKKKEPRFDEATRQEVLRLWNENLLINQITELVGLKRYVVQKIIAKWYAEQGLSIPDARKRRKELAYKGRRRSKGGSSPNTDDNVTTIASDREVATYPLSTINSEGGPKKECCP